MPDQAQRPARPPERAAGASRQTKRPQPSRARTRPRSFPGRPAPVHTVPMAVPRNRATEAEARPTGLPPALSAALAAFNRHLAAERALSRHTVRAYHGDIQSLLEYARRGRHRRPRRARPGHAARLAGRPAPGGRGPGDARPPGRGRPGLHRLRAPPGLARGRSGTAARHPQGPPGAAAGAAPGRDEPGPGRLRGPGAARVRRPAERDSGGAGAARRRGPRAALRVRHPGQRAVRARPRRPRPRPAHGPGVRQGRQGARRPGRGARGAGGGALGAGRPSRSRRREQRGRRSSSARAAAVSTRGPRAASCTPG